MEVIMYVLGVIAVAALALALPILVMYFVIKAAVKNGVKEAYDEIAAQKIAMQQAPAYYPYSGGQH